MRRRGGNCGYENCRLVVICLGYINDVVSRWLNSKPVANTLLIDDSGLVVYKLDVIVLFTSTVLQ